MEGVSFAEIIKPFADQPGGILWDVFLYGILIGQAILLATLFSGSLRDVIFVAITVMCAVADKTYLFGFIDPGLGGPAAPNVEAFPQAMRLKVAVGFHTQDSFMTFAARIAMFALPMIIITQTKIKRAKPVAVLLVVASLIYAFGRWFMQVYPVGKWDTEERASLDSAIYMAQASGFLLVAGEGFRRRWLTRKRQP